MKKLKSNQSGFTILELVIATAVFSIVLLLMTYSIIQISRTYVKGYIVSETGNNLRSIQDQLTQAVQASDNSATSGIYIPASAGADWFCINGYLYKYQEGVEQSSSASVFYAVKPNGGCGPSTDVSSYTCSNTPGCNQLVGNNIQIPPGGFSISEIDTANNLYKISISLLYGSPNSYSSNNPPRCLASFAGGEFCAAVQTTTTVGQRV